jgi:hypothetical protein
LPPHWGSATRQTDFANSSCPVFVDCGVGIVQKYAFDLGYVGIVGNQVIRVVVVNRMAGPFAIERFSEFPDSGSQVKSWTPKEYRERFARRASWASMAACV